MSEVSSKIPNRNWSDASQGRRQPMRDGIAVDGHALAPAQVLERIDDRSGNAGESEREPDYGGAEVDDAKGQHHDK